LRPNKFAKSNPISIYSTILCCSLLVHQRGLMATRRDTGEGASGWSSSKLAQKPKEGIYGRVQDASPPPPRTKKKAYKLVRSYVGCKNNTVRETTVERK
jgi:hypothetical protein